MSLKHIAYHHLVVHDYVSFFFFQAEDGIRDLTVTGVQTCALPIWQVQALAQEVDAHQHVELTQAQVPQDLDALEGLDVRSEERRVGKECRSRRSPDHKKKKSDRRTYLCRT